MEKMTTAVIIATKTLIADETAIPTTAMPRRANWPNWKTTATTGTGVMKIANVFGYYLWEDKMRARKKLDIVTIGNKITIVIK